MHAHIKHERVDLRGRATLPQGARAANVARLKGSASFVQDDTLGLVQFSLLLDTAAHPGAGSCLTLATQRSPIFAGQRR